MTIAGPSLPPMAKTYTGSIASIDLPSATAMEKASWEFVQSDTVITSRCAACTGGRVICGKCRGTTMMHCATTERCRICKGTGTVRKTSKSGNVQFGRCPTCRGVRQLTCHKCRGTGRVPCTRCHATGSLRCKACNATGWNTSFTKGTITRRVETQSSGDVEKSAPFRKAAKKAQWRTVTCSGTAIPQGLPERALTELPPLIETAPPDEILRGLEVQILPVSAVTYDLGGTAETVYIVGDERAVHAAKIKSRRRRRRVLTIRDVAIGIAAVVALLYVLRVL